MGFVHLHVHSQFSILDGTAKPGAIAERAASLGMSACALTDTSNMFAAVAWYKACKNAGIRAILGAELNVQPEGIDYEDPRRVDGGYQLILLVENDLGYANLCKLITASIFDGVHYKPRVDLELLRAHSDGLIVLTGGRKGLFGRSLGRNNEALAREWLEPLLSIFGEQHLYFELQDLGLDGQPEVNGVVRRLADEHGRLTVATNAVHYLQAHDAPVHEALNAIGLGCTLSDRRRLVAPTDQAWLKGQADMLELFPHDAEAVMRTGDIAARCEYHFDFDTYHFPATDPPDTTPKGQPDPDTEANWAYFYKAFPPPAHYGMPGPSQAVPPKIDGAGNLDGYFEWYSKAGLVRRLEHIDTALHTTYHERLDLEMRIIEGMGFPAYMLIVAEFINWSKDHDIPVGPGRGSAAGSLVAYSMSITDIDPIRYGLLFERFLNPERVSMPDIDVDFCQDRREEAIEHVRQKYGSPLVSQIITYGTLKAKAAIRDVARVLELSYNEADRLSKMVPEKLGTTLTQALEQVEAMRDMREGDPKIRRVLDLALAVEGSCRQVGIHAAGVVIADKPLVNYAPLYRDGPDGGPVVQYAMKSAEGIGLIKFDFLGLKTLDQIRDAVALVSLNHGVDIDMSQLPVDDALTYQMLSSGDALGIFQLESSGMRDLLARLKPNCIDDMVALVALYRPGPLESGMTDDFVERKHGRTPVTYPHPWLEPLLKGTYGTIIYQEQVMQIAQVLAGYSLGQADLLRRAMGKKDAAEMDKQRSTFLDGAHALKVDPKVAEGIFDLMAKFAAYGFNKSHSAAYGYVSYQTAWLKAHYRPEYMAALMTIESGNTDKVLAYIADCQGAGIRIDAVCINHSDLAFSVPPPSERNGQDSIRFGMGAVKNVGSASILAILEVRAAGGPFTDAFDFFERVDPKRANKRVAENLIKAGAFDFSNVPRTALLAGLEQAFTLGARAQEDKRAGQGSLFAMLGGAKQPRFRFPALPEAPHSVKLKAEREVLGLFLTGHPMQVRAQDVRRFATCPLAELSDKHHESEVRIVGLPCEVKTVRTKRGDRMAFVQIEDVGARIEGVFFSNAWARSQRAIEADEPVLLTGRVEAKDGTIKLLVSSAEGLADVRARSTREVTLTLTVDELSGDAVERLLALLKGNPGACPARLVVRVPGRYEVHLGLPRLAIHAGFDLEEACLSLFGRADAVVMA